MSLFPGAQVDFNNLLREGGPIRIRYFTYSGGSASYDDDVVLTQSGTDVWDSGLIFPYVSRRVNPMSTTIGTLAEQGKDLMMQQWLYVKGTINLSGQAIKIGIGSPVQYENTIQSEGMNTWTINGSPIFQEVIIRRLPIGSLIGE